MDNPSTKIKTIGTVKCTADFRDAGVKEACPINDNPDVTLAWQALEICAGCPYGMCTLTTRGRCVSGGAEDDPDRETDC